MLYRYNVTFIAKPGRETSPNLVKGITYKVKYDPPMASVASSFGTCFSNILLDAVCYLTEYNTTPCIVKVIMKGPFFQRHIEQAKKIFDLYKKAERVFVEFETYDYSD